MRQASFLSEPMPIAKLRPPQGSEKLVFTKFINRVPLEQCHHKPMGIYGSDLLKLASKGDHHDIFTWLCDDIAPMAQGL